MENMQIVDNYIPQTNRAGAGRESKFLTTEQLKAIADLKVGQTVLIDCRPIYPNISTNYHNSGNCWGGMKRALKHLAGYEFKGGKHDQDTAYIKCVKRPESVEGPQTETVTQQEAVTGNTEG